MQARATLCCSLGDSDFQRFKTLQLFGVEIFQGRVNQRQLLPLTVVRAPPNSEETGSILRLARMKAYKDVVVPNREVIGAITKVWGSFFLEYGCQSEIKFIQFTYDNCIRTIVLIY